MQSRRSFILGGALAVGGAITGIHLFRSYVKSSEEQAVYGVINNLSELPGAVRFGNISREQRKNNNSMETVISISKHLQSIHGDFHHENIGEVLEQQIQTELQTNQIHRIDGWYLTRTEANLCVLAAMISKD